jgi:predicted nucleotidyltransferase
LEKEARADLARILKLIVDKFHPQRIYQWGSLTHAGRFRGYSDIDLALEGILDPEQYFRLLGEVQGMTRFPVDIVQLEIIMPEYAEDIREKGVLLYEHA